MTVARFLELVRQAQARSLGAMLAPEAEDIKREANRVGNSLLAEWNARERAGKPRRICPPRGGIRLQPEQVLAALKAVPRADRSMTVRAAMRGWLVRRYPCRG